MKIYSIKIDLLMDDGKIDTVEYHKIIHEYENANFVKLETIDKVCIYIPLDRIRYMVSREV